MVDRMSFLFYFGLMKQKSKRHLRILPDASGYYVHVTSRIRGQDFLFNDEEKRIFVKLLKKWALFSGLGVVTYCVMSNHFHILLYVPAPKNLQFSEVCERLRYIWSEDQVSDWVAGYDLIRNEKEKVEYIEQIVRRMHQLPEFMRALKQCFSRGFNRRHRTRGTLWEDRYQSVVVEPTGVALLSVSAYIDLNPVRAKICSDPALYECGGYGDAIKGDLEAQSGLKHLILHRVHGVMPYGARRAVSRKRLEQEGTAWWIIPSAEEETRRRILARADWDDVQKIYRCWLYRKGVKGDEGSPSTGVNRRRGGFTREELEKVYEAGGSVPMTDWLSETQPFLSRGGAYGGADFLYHLFVNLRDAFGPGRVNAGLAFENEGAGLQVLHRSFGHHGRPNKG